MRKQSAFIGALKVRINFHSARTLGMFKHSSAIIKALVDVSYLRFCIQNIIRVGGQAVTIIISATIFTSIGNAEFRPTNTESRFEFTGSNSLSKYIYKTIAPIPIK